MRMLIVYILLGVFAIIAAASCTNHEIQSDLDVLTPVDSTQGYAPHHNAQYYLVGRL